MSLPLHQQMRVQRRNGSRDRVRYAVVGLGHIAQNAVLPAFEHASENAELARVQHPSRKLQFTCPSPKKPKLMHVALPLRSKRRHNCKGRIMKKHLLKIQIAVSSLSLLLPAFAPRNAGARDTNLNRS